MIWILDLGRNKLPCIRFTIIFSDQARLDIKYTTKIVYNTLKVLGRNYRHMLQLKPEIRQNYCFSKC